MFHRRGLVIGLAIGLGFVRDWVLFRYRTSFVFTVRVRATPSVVSRNVGRRADLSGHWELDIPRSVLTKAFEIPQLSRRKPRVHVQTSLRALIRHPQLKSLPYLCLDGRSPLPSTLFFSQAASIMSYVEFYLVRTSSTITLLFCISKFLFCISNSYSDESS